jgi:SAM-dependent methyltransferase
MRPTLAELYFASDSDPAPIVEFLRELAASYDLPQPLHVLDVGCGPGRLLAPLERLRWEVTGMEPDPDFLASARAIGETSRRIRVRRGGFREIRDGEAFDLVVGINSSFAHLLTPADRADALQRIHDALRPGGVVFLDLPNLPWFLHHFRAPEPYSFTAQGQAVTLLRRHEPDFHDATVTTTDEYVFPPGTDPELRFVHRYGITTLPELRHHLDEAGFTDIRTFRSYASRASERLDGARMLIAARKPA